LAPMRPKPIMPSSIGFSCDEVLLRLDDMLASE